MQTVVASLSRLEGAYHAAKLLIEQRQQQCMQSRKQTEERGLQSNYEGRESLLMSLQRDRLMFLLHAKLFMHSFVTLWYAKLDGVVLPLKGCLLHIFLS